MAPMHPAPVVVRRTRPRGLPGRRRRISPAAVAALLLASCGTSTLPSATATPTGTGIEVAPELLGPLTMLGPCSEVVDPGLDQQVPGLPLPDEAFLLDVAEQNGLVNVRGYAAMTPIVLQVWLREQPELEMITVENEIQESETLWQVDGRRVFFKAAAVCELGSVFIAAIAGASDADRVPTPSGSPTGQ